MTGTNVSQVEAFKENGVIVYRIKTVGKPNGQKTDEVFLDIGTDLFVNVRQLCQSLDDSEGGSGVNGDNADRSGSEKSSSSEDKKVSSHNKASNPLPDLTLLQRFISGKFCVDGGEGWWRHRVCYNRKITQYHIVSSGMEDVCF